MGFPNRIDDEEFLRILDEAQDAYYAEAEAKRVAEAAAPIVLTVDADEPADVTEAAQE